MIWSNPHQWTGLARLGTTQLPERPEAFLIQKVCGSAARKKSECLLNGVLLLCRGIVRSAHFYFCQSCSCISIILTITSPDTFDRHHISAVRMTGQRCTKTLSISEANLATVQNWTHGIPNTQAALKNGNSVSGVSNFVKNSRGSFHIRPKTQGLDSFTIPSAFPSVATAVHRQNCSPGQSNGHVYPKFGVPSGFPVDKIHDNEKGWLRILIAGEPIGDFQCYMQVWTANVTFENASPEPPRLPYQSEIAGLSPFSAGCCKFCPSD